MKNLIPIFLFFFLLSSCDKEESTYRPVNNSTGSGSQDYEYLDGFELNIDTSDLYLLPQDTGGKHLPYELDSTEANYAHYIYTPSGYDSVNMEYPLLIFLHGWNENLGNQPLDDLLYGGITKLLETSAWKPSYPFIVASPQLRSSYWKPNEVHEFIKYLMENYKINTNRIYLTGLSLGGGGCWYYVGQVSDHYAAAVVPISARGESSLVYNLKKIPIWAFHGLHDESVDPIENYGSVTLVEAINDADPIYEARVSLYTNLAHDAWTKTYNGTGNQTPHVYHKFDVSIYDWMLSYKKEPAK